MADLIRKVTVQKGYDPRDFVVFAYGGAGPVHAGIYARELGRALGDRAPGRRCARCGRRWARPPADLLHIHESVDIQANPLRSRARRPRVRRAGGAGPGPAPGGTPSTSPRRGSRAIGRRALQGPDQRGGGGGARRPPGRRGPGSARGRLSPALREPLRIGRGLPGSPGGDRHLSGAHLIGQPEAATAGGSRKGRVAGARGPGRARAVYWAEGGDFDVTPIFWGEQLQAGNRIAGPAVIQVPDTTIVVHQEQAARVDLTATCSSSCEDREGDGRSLRWPIRPIPRRSRAAPYDGVTFPYIPGRRPRHRSAPPAPYRLDRQARSHHLRGRPPPSAGTSTRSWE